MRTESRLKDKVIVIAGAANVIGIEHAILLALHGARILVCDENLLLAQTVADEIIASGGIALPHQLIPDDSESWQHLCDHTLKTFGAMDCLINATCALPFELDTLSGDRLGSFLTSVQNRIWLGMKHCAVHLIKHRGSIVNIAPVLNHSKPSLLLTQVRESLSHLSKNMALQLAPGCRVNLVCPGHLSLAPTLHSSPQWIVPKPRHIPMRRKGFPEDIAYCSLFLASDEAGYITGCDLPVDGGVTAETDLHRLLGPAVGF